MNRRDFIKGILAAAAAAQVPISVAAAEEAADALATTAIEDYGNGWYRVSMTVDDSTVSAYTKRGIRDHIRFQYRNVRAWFNLETGEVGKIECVKVSDDQLTIDADGAYVFGAQIEEAT